MTGNVVRLCAVAAAGVALALGSVIGASASIAPAASASTPSAAPSHVTATAGAQLWRERYNGPGNGVDQARSVAISPSGKTVFVTGNSYANSGSGIGDFATVAYNATSGAQLWTRRYNGPGNDGAQAQSVVVSPSGKTVFVTGFSYGSSSTGYEDFATVAYNAVTGAQLWVKLYNGTGNFDDVAYSAAVSPSGTTLYVTGETYVSGEGSPYYGTVAYNATTGAQLWAETYHGSGNVGYEAEYAAAVAVSPSGKIVFVTGQGSTSNTPGYATVAYNAVTGARLWVKVYAYPGSGDGTATALKVSPSGKAVYVTGYYESASSAGYATVAYNAVTGAQLWLKRYSPKGGSDAAYAVAVSPSGKLVYVTGGVYGGGGEGDEDYATVAYNAVTGAQVWAKRYGAGGTSYAYATAVSPSGKTVYVTGGSDGDYATIGYNAATGAQLWVKRYAGAGIPSLPGAALSMAVSRATGDVFVTGYIVVSTRTINDYVTIAYRS